MVTDTIANALTKIRNAVRVQHTEVCLSVNKMILKILEILKDNGFINDFNIVEEKNKQKSANVKLFYNPDPSIVSLDRISKPGRRVYVKCNEIPRVYNGLGIAIVSTSKGVMTDKEAKSKNVGGELVCVIF